MAHKIRIILSVLSGNAIVINQKDNITKVYVGENNDVTKIKQVASDFFRQAYKLN